MPHTSTAARNRLALLVALGIDNFGSGLFLPLLVVYAVRVVGLPLGLAGTVISIGTLAGLAVPPFAGRLVDRWGPRPVVVTSQLLQAAGACGFLLADGIVLTLVASMLLAAGQQTFYSSLFALIADVAGPGPKDRPYAVVGMVRSAMFGSGALVTAATLVGSGDRGLHIAVAVNAVSFLAAAVLLWVFVHPGRHDSSVESATDATTVLRNRPYLALIAVTCLLALALDFFLVGLPVFVLEVTAGPSWLPGVSLALLTVVTSTSATLALRTTRHLARTTAMSIGAVVFICWCGLCALTPALPTAARPAWVIATTLLLAAGNLMFGTRVNALAEAAAPRATRGRHLAAFQYAFTVAGVLTPAIVALFSVSSWAPFAVVAAAAAAGAAALPVLSRRLPAHAVRGHEPKDHPAAAH